MPVPRLLEHGRTCGQPQKEYKACSTQEECSFPVSQGVINKAGAFYIQSNSMLLNGKQREGDERKPHFAEREKKWTSPFI